MKDDDLIQFKEYYKRVGKYIHLDTITPVVIGSNKANATPKEAITFLKEIAIREKLNHDYYKDLEFFAHYHSAGIKQLIRKEKNFKKDLKYKNDRKAFAKIFKNCKNKDVIGGFVPEIESITFKVKDQSRTIRIDSNIENKMILQLNYDLYKLYFDLEENIFYDTKHRFESERKLAMKQFYKLHLYCLHELKAVSQVGSTRFISQLIEKLGYNLSEKITESSPESYLNDIFKQVKSQYYGK